MTVSFLPNLGLSVPSSGFKFVLKKNYQPTSLMIFKNCGNISKIF